jgi:N-acetylglucosamine malate deacetylase 1
MKKVLIITPHPDDETLGCGGTILRHLKEGDQVYWLICTTITEELGFSKARIEKRADEINRVNQAFRFTGFRQLGFPTTFLDQVPQNQIIEEISKFLTEIQADTLYLPYRNDVHSDHANVFDASISCTKSFRYPFVKRVRVYETLSETEFGLRTDDPGFKPNLWIYISSFLDQKVEIMKGSRQLERFISKDFQQ